MTKKIYLFLVVLFAGISAGAQVLPAFSTESEPIWYKVQFKEGSAYLADQGSGSNLLTATAADVDAQLWQLIGTQDDFVMKSKSGNYVNYSGSKFTTSTTGVALKLVASTASGAGNYWEIQRKSASGSMNQWGGAGAGKEIGEYGLGDVNNPLSFIATQAVLPQFSEGENETWYFLQFCNSGNVITDKGVGTAARLESATGMFTQLWKLVGTQDNFQLVNRLGHYIVVSSTADTSQNPRNDNPLQTSESPYEAGYQLVETTNTENPYNWEIKPNDKARRFNQWGGTDAGRGIGLWDAGDKNNPLRFVDASDWEYNEYHVVEAGTRPTDINDFALWYNVPVAHTGVSDTWMEYALPIGNGQIGATIRGGLYKDEIQFNEKTLWAGNTTNSGNQGYFQNFGSIVVADKSESFSLTDDSKPVKEYTRYLDIIDGVGGVNYKSSDEATTYRRRYFVSATDKVLVAHYEAQGTDKLKLLFSYVPDELINASGVTYADGKATFSGAMEVVKYNTAFEVLASEGATVTTTDEGILVENAEWANLLMAAATDYDATKNGCVSGETAADIAGKVTARIDAAKAQTYETLLASHVAKHSELMNRVALSIGEKSDKTTEDLIKFYATDANKTTPEGLYLESLYFQYGRYMTIGANLDTSIHAPSNLQGIWNDRSNTPFWHCDIHSDINVEMNYWPADPTNLSEMHLPYLEHIIDMATAENSPWAALAAKIKSGAQGWTVAVENNIFGGTSNWCNGSIKTCGAWYCTHLWRYYKYTLNKDFLKRALPVMYDYCLFTKSIATLDSNGLYEITGEWSPEHGPGDVTAFAQQTSYEVLDEVFKAHAELGEESPLTETQLDEIRELYEKFDKGLWVETYNGVDNISEWKNNPLEDQGHRHLSHLMCLYPFSQVSAFDTTAEGQRLFQAAYNGQIARNGDVTGWSMGWQTNTYARCLDGDNARRNLTLALRHSTSYVIAMGGQGGCYYNLFDAHSPFQIDGNYGCTSGVAEMLLQSYDDVITILPALPTAWANGSVRGLKAQGDYTVDEEWAEGKATRASITNNRSEQRTVSVRLNNRVNQYVINGGETLVIEMENGEFPTAIQRVSNGQVNAQTIYDLSGRRVSKVGQGVYIVNGGKVIF